MLHASVPRCVAFACALATQDPVGPEPATPSVEAVLRRELAPGAGPGGVRWAGPAGANPAPFEVALLAFEDALGDAKARARFDAELAFAQERLAPGGRIAVAPREAPPDFPAPTSQYLYAGRVARRLGLRGLTFERELALRECAGRRAAWIFVPAPPLPPLPVEELPRFDQPLGGKRFALLSEAPTRASALRALLARGIARDLEEWHLGERFAADELPSAPGEGPELRPRLLPLGPNAVGGTVGAPAEGTLDGVLVADALHGALDRRARLELIHRSLAVGGELWILERCRKGAAPALECSARRGLDPERLFAEVIAAGFAVRAIAEQDGALRIYTTRSAPPAPRQREASMDALTAAWQRHGLPSSSAAHMVGAHALLEDAALRALGGPPLGRDPLAGPLRPVELLVVASWEHHPAPALFLDRPSSHLLPGGWLIVVHDQEAGSAGDYADPDRIAALQPELRPLGEIAGAPIGFPDAALWLFRRP